MDIHAPGALMLWYPAAVEPARAALVWERAQRMLRDAPLSGVSRFPGRVLETVSRFWLDKPIELHYLEMRAIAADARERAIAELVYGQLLITCRLRASLSHLAAAVEQGRGLLTTQDYFALLRRHALLGSLYLGDEPRPPQDLSSLLLEAAVIRRLKGAIRDSTRWVSDARDTVG
jgi:hypothetical protein